MDSPSVLVQQRRLLRKVRRVFKKDSNLDKARLMDHAPCVVQTSSAVSAYSSKSESACQILAGHDVEVIDSEPKEGLLIAQEGIPGPRAIYQESCGSVINHRDNFEATSAHDNPQNGTIAHEGMNPTDLERSLPACVDWVFTYQDEADYTTGPARMVSSTDGSRNCPAILLNMELSQRMQNMLKAQRELQETELVTERKRNSIFRRDQKLLATVIKLDNNLDRLEKRDRDEDSDLSDDRARKVQDTRSEIHSVEEARSKLQQEEQAIIEQLGSRYEHQKRLQAEVNDILDDVFVNCNLLEPQTQLVDTDVEVPIILGTASASASRNSSLHNDTTRQRGMSDDEPFDIAETDPQTALHDALRRKTHEKRMILLDAEQEFNMRESRYFEHLENYRAEEARGNPVRTKTDFDLAHLEYGRALTRNLITAERNFNLAKAKAQAAGVMHDAFQDSHFVDCFDDGYKESMDAEVAAKFDWTAIERWLDGTSIADYEGSASGVEVDEWDARLDDRFDSVSVLADGIERSRIDQWQATAQAWGDTTARNK